MSGQVLRDEMVVQVQQGSYPSVCVVPRREAVDAKKGWIAESPTGAKPC
jgi:hypothetical protein